MALLSGISVVAVQSVKPRRLVVAVHVTVLRDVGVRSFGGNPPLRRLVGFLLAIPHHLRLFSYNVVLVSR